jgi:disulfide bond formation protein DsbB
MAADWDEHFMLKLVFYCLFFYGIVLTVEQAGIEVVIKNPPAMQCIKYQTGLFGKQCTQYENKN